MADDDLRAAYQELCKSYHAIDDFRAKLLGFLPLATGGGLILLLNNPKDVEGLSESMKNLLATVGFFGAFITLGLFAYEIYGIRKCGALIKAGQRMEESLLKVSSLVKDGQFQSRPDEVARFINEPFASGIIYPAVLAAWTFFALFFKWPDGNPWIPIFVFIVGCAGTLIYDYCLRNPKKPSTGQYG